MPNLFSIGGYKVYFWSNEGDEPIHVHISKGKPTPDATKVWLTKRGGCVLADNGSHIPSHELRELLEVLSAQFFVICSKGKEHFKVEEIKYYC